MALGGLALAGCGKPPRMPARRDSKQKAQGVKWELMLADPLQEQALAIHTPLERWRTHHLEYINARLIGEDQCMKCHEPESYCNNCHKYVGVKRVVDTTGDRTPGQVASAKGKSP